MKSNMCIKQDVLNVLNTFPLHYVSHSGCVCVVVESVHHGHGSERHLQRDTSWSFGVQHEIFIFTQVFEKSLCSQQCLTQVKGQWDWLRLDSVRFLVVCLTQKREKTTLSCSPVCFIETSSVTQIHHRSSMSSDIIFPLNGRLIS